MIGQEILKINSNYLFVSISHILCSHTEIWIKTIILIPFVLKDYAAVLGSCSVRPFVSFFVPCLTELCYPLPLFFLSISSVVFRQQYFHVTFLKSNPLSHSSNYTCGITKLCVSLTNCSSNYLSCDSHTTQRIFPYLALKDWTLYWRRLVFTVR
jgi:hypothetical protein